MKWRKRVFGLLNTFNISECHLKIIDTCSFLIFSFLCWILILLSVIHNGLVVQSCLVHTFVHTFIIIHHQTILWAVPHVCEDSNTHTVYSAGSTQWKVCTVLSSSHHMAPIWPWINIKNNIKGKPDFWKKSFLTCSHLYF